jgi:type I restriction enzyme, R subunit
LIDHGQILGVVEAKKLSIGPQNVLWQAQCYAKGLIQAELGWGAFGVPFLYATNGEVIWHHDIRHAANRSRQIAGFHSPDALRERLSRDFDAAIAALRAIPNDSPRLRPYQREANKAVEQAIAERKNRMLVAMATGTGKTFTTVNQIYRLMKSGVAKRVLFLVDRRALAAQAVKALAAITAGRTFTPDQQQWLDRIRQHLTQNLSIDPDDFESIPVFALSGGWGKAAKVFNGQLPDLLQEINAAIAV